MTTPNRAVIRVTRRVNAARLAVENPGAVWQLNGDELSSATLTEAQLRAVVEAHDPDGAVPPPPAALPDPLDELLTAIEGASSLAGVRTALLQGLRPALRGRPR